MSAKRVCIVGACTNLSTYDGVLCLTHKARMDRTGNVMGTAYGSWRIQGLCVVKPSFMSDREWNLVWFPPPRKNKRQSDGFGDARRFCERCPVREQCLADALIEESEAQVNVSGMRGGKSPEERHALLDEVRRGDGVMSAEITETEVVINGVVFLLRHADCWDPPEGEDRAAVYYEDEERPVDAQPLYRLIPKRVAS